MAKFTLSKESERRSRMAYEAMVNELRRVGVNVEVERVWDELPSADKYAWLQVYDACSADAEKFKTGPR